METTTTTKADREYMHHTYPEGMTDQVEKKKWRRQQRLLAAGGTPRKPAAVITPTPTPTPTPVAEVKPVNPVEVDRGYWNLGDLSAKELKESDEKWSRTDLKRALKNDWGIPYCPECGEKVLPYQEAAEVILTSEVDTEDAPHLLMHSDCFSDEKYSLA